MIKIPVKFQKDRYKTVGGVALTRFPLQTWNHAKKSKLKKAEKKIITKGFWKKHMHIFRPLMIKTPVKFQKDRS